MENKTLKPGDEALIETPNGPIRLSIATEGLLVKADKFGTKLKINQSNDFSLYAEVVTIDS